ncbi:MAG: P-loop NTPase [Syntrophales bacterium]|jgi:CO dehydrogenase maturation factor|nr:P-loop NTPase [Syntrophales bacterium]
MKLAIAGKGGVGKTSLTVWLGDYLARQGEEVMLLDADTALSLGQALGLKENDIPIPLIQNKELIKERVGEGFFQINPKVDDLPDKISKQVGNLKFMVMGTIADAGSGCACSPNALVKALLAHLIVENRQWIIVDLEAGVEHLGRGTIEYVDGLIVVSEPSMRGLQTAARISVLARQMGLERQALIINRAPSDFRLPDIPGLPPLTATIPVLSSLTLRQLESSSVLDLEERENLDKVAAKLISALKK